MHRLKIATPVSTIFNATPRLSEILELTDVLEVREYSRPVASPLPRIYHCDWSIVDEWSAKEIQEIVNMILNNKPELVTFHVNSCYQRPPVADGMFQPQGRKFSGEELMDRARANFARLEEKLGKLPLKAVENTNYYPTGAYEIVTDAGFINKLMAEFDLHLLLDVAHAQITAINKKIAFEDYLGELNLGKAVQFHLSRPGKDPKDSDLARDFHEVLEDFDWTLIKSMIPRCPNLEYLTLEYYKNDEQLISMLKKLRKIIQ